MVNSLDEWLWSSWFCMVGYVESPAWLSTDVLLMMFANNRHDAIKSYREFVQCCAGKNVWDNLQHQVF